MINSLSIEGFRGFKNKTEISFSAPDKMNKGSGLNILVGPNNSGKTSSIEAIHLIVSNAGRIEEKARNKQSNQVCIELEHTNNGNGCQNKYLLRIDPNNGAVATRYKNDRKLDTSHYERIDDVFILSNKRNISSKFQGDNATERQNYLGNIHNYDYRSQDNNMSQFGSRLVKVCEDPDNKAKFDKYLSKVVSGLSEWCLDYEDGNAFLKLKFIDGSEHDSKGTGDGFINIFNIIDALYDAREGDTIVIDEPEVSLHPDLQRKLFQLLIDLSKDIQIIIATHSQLFIDWEMISKKATLYRFKQTTGGLKCFPLSDKSKEIIHKLLGDTHNVHTFGVEANEIFFLNDNVILVEGQEDVIGYKKVFQKMSYRPNASFFGWGMGGKHNLEHIFSILSDLGYGKVFAIVDSDFDETEQSKVQAYKNYMVYRIKAPDIRNKLKEDDPNYKKIKKIIEKFKELGDGDKNRLMDVLDDIFVSKVGVLDSLSVANINSDYEEDMIKLIGKMKEYFGASAHEEENGGGAVEVVNEKEPREYEFREFLNNIDDKLYHNKKYRKYARPGGSVIVELGSNKNGDRCALARFCIENQGIYGAIFDYLLVSRKDGETKIARTIVVKNDLPISRIRKVIEKIFH